MKAYGEHILIQKPNKKTVLESGLILPDNMEDRYEYGRVTSVGNAVADVAVGDFVFYDPLGTRELCIDPMRDDGLKIAHRSHIFAIANKKDLEDRKLPIP